MISRRLLTVVICDMCKETDQNGDGGSLLFDNVEQARRCLDDWTINDDGSVVCALCIGKRLCAEQGHNWDPFTAGDGWQDCNSSGDVHPDRECWQWRFCLRCDVSERRPAPAPAPVSSGGVGGAA